jgi:hypothetical protein
MQERIWENAGINAPRLYASIRKAKVVTLQRVRTFGLLGEVHLTPAFSGTEVG